VGDHQAAVAADDDETIDPVTGESGEDGIGAVDMRSRRRTLYEDVEGIVAVRRPQDRSTLGENAGDVIGFERPGLIRQQPGEAIQEARHLEAMTIHGRLTQGRVHPGAIAARRHDTYVPQWSHDRPPPLPRA
jgi:hypothetical protein